VQDGAKWGDGFSCGLNIVMGKMTGGKYQRFLDRIQAYYYFPIAIAKESKVAQGTIQVLVNAEAGCLDRIGGLAFGIKNVGNYFLLCLDALEKTFTLFEFVNNRRIKRQTKNAPIESGRWYTITAKISETTIKGYLDDELLLEHPVDGPLAGYVGLGTKADATTLFDKLVIQVDNDERVIPFLEAKKSARDEP
jgi:pyruvate,water dikinase